MSEKDRDDQPIDPTSLVSDLVSVNRLPQVRGALTVEEQNDLERQNMEIYLEELNRQTLVANGPPVRPGKHSIIVNGDPYAGFAKGPRDL